jgi:hypothetical protein
MINETEDSEREIRSHNEEYGYEASFIVDRATLHDWYLFSQWLSVSTKINSSNVRIEHERTYSCVLPAARTKLASFHRICCARDHSSPDNASPSSLGVFYEKGIKGG